jgi:hypothetical protein
MDCCDWKFKADTFRLLPMILLSLAPFFPGLRFGPRDSPNEREDLFGIERVESYLVLYRWPKAGETADLTEAGQGQFSIVSNSLKFKLSSGATFNGNCKPKK